MAKEEQELTEDNADVIVTFTDKRDGRSIQVLVQDEGDGIRLSTNFGEGGANSHYGLHGNLWLNFFEGATKGK